MGLFTGNNIAAQGRWAGADTAKSQGGKVAQTGTGVYTITLEQGLNANECVPLITVQDATVAVSPSVVHTSATVKTVTLRDSTNAAINSNFGWGVWQLPAT